MNHELQIKKREKESNGGNKTRVKTTGKDDGDRKEERDRSIRNKQKSKNKVCNIYSRLL
jgi:hypothetical protein